MAWQELTGEVSKVKIHESGKITWNACAHSMLGAPTGVLVFYDPVGNRLGLLRTIREQDYCHVIYTGEHEFEIDAAEQLSNAGISVESVYTTTLYGPLPPDPAAPPMQSDGNGLAWFSAPE